MPKLRLAIEELAVESFDPVSRRDLRGGTVRGHQQTEPETCLITGCGTCYTYEYYCGESADGTCEGSQCQGTTCGYPVCPDTYGPTCAAGCRTLGVYC